MNILNNLSFKNLYNFTHPQLSLGFIGVVNLFFVSLLFCHDHDDSVFHLLAKYLWFVTITIIAYAKYS